MEQTFKTLSRLPEERLREVSDFADFILKKHDEETIQKGIESLVTESDEYYFLKEEEDIYTINDLKERY